MTKFGTIENGFVNFKDRTAYPKLQTTRTKMSIVENTTKQILTAEEKEDKRLFQEAMSVLRAAEKAEKAAAKAAKAAEKEEKQLVDEAMTVLKRGEKEDAKKAKRAAKKADTAAVVDVE